MSWVDDWLKRQERTEAERAFISVHAATLYDELWEEVSNRVDDARKGGMLVSTNGSATKGPFCWEPPPTEHTENPSSS